MPKYLSPFDPHVHLRGHEYFAEDFLGLGLRDAKAVGLCGVAEMPNTSPPLTSKTDVDRRCQEIDRRESELSHFINVGLTSDEIQVQTMLDLVENHPRVWADKTFYTHSTGNMGILDKDYQDYLWKLKGERGYRGVSIGHFEDESLFEGVFNPDDPVSHSKHQCEEAELFQVERQIESAYKHKFQGTFYIAHVSSPMTVDYVNNVRDSVPFRIILEATFHHTLLNWEDYNLQGHLVKMNPPLRDPIRQQQLFNHLLAGDFDIIGTDHAPHTLSKKKDATSPASGIPALPFWPRFIEILQLNGMSQKAIEDLTFYRAAKLFAFGHMADPPEPQQVDVEYDPSLWDAYGWNPFESVDRNYVQNLEKSFGEAETQTGQTEASSETAS